MKTIKTVMAASLFLVLMALCACSSGKDTEERRPVRETGSNASSVETAVSESGSSLREESTSQAEQTVAPEPEKTSAGIRPEFQKAMDDYKAFFEDYADFMKKFSESDDPSALMMEYLSFMSSYSEYMESFEDIDTEDLTDREYSLYIRTTSEITAILYEAI